MSQSAWLTSTQRPSWSISPVPMGARDHRAGRVVAGGDGLLHAQRPHVDREAVQTGRVADLARARVALQRGAAERLDLLPQLRRKGLRDRLTHTVVRAALATLQCVAGDEREAQVEIEDQDGGVGQLGVLWRVHPFVFGS
jgi:hypothetical protein